MLDQYSDQTTLDTLRYLIGEVNYCGRVIDCMDQRLLNCYMNDYFCENLIVQQDFLLSELPYYFIPKEENLDSYKKYIQSLPLKSRLIVTYIAVPCIYSDHYF